MRKQALLLALTLPASVFPVTAIAGQHLIEFKSERRGDTFQRHFAELHSAWGQQGIGILNTTLELNGTTTALGTATNIHPGFSYLMPVTKTLLLGPAAKYNYIAGKKDAIKAGIAFAYTGFESIQMGGQIRYDHQLGNNSFDLVRSDLIVGFPLLEDSYLTTTSTNMNPVEGDNGSWQEYELEFKYTGFEGIHPYLGTTITTDNDPLGQGDNAIIAGFYVPFS
ncbi:hypothetical protein J4N42_15725 [Vibrio sp. SCSIO 43135]|uniref:hypothetical protein n=1 Tax=Vibrio sp. SCSIO 43135 TaxID=2819096 RepID=UPI0020756DA9|nr:hypothetical protein [Vibrio sp. SCSIO 43135]USD43625.1 hypothetical protein J4N42_15725 [Vibrio sp. SCSIO 43135]